MKRRRLESPKILAELVVAEARPVMDILERERATAAEGDGEKEEGIECPLGLEVLYGREWSEGGKGDEIIPRGSQLKPRRADDRFLSSSVPCCSS